MSDSHASNAPLEQLDDQGSSKAETSRATRAKLLAAALDCVEELGFAEAGVNKVLEYANLGRGALAYHFPTRTELMAAAFYQAVRSRIDALTAFANENDMTALSLIERIRAYRRICQKHFYAIAEISMAMRTNAEMKARFQEMSGPHSPPFSKIFPELFDPSQPRDRSNFLALIVNGIETQKVFMTSRLADELFEAHCADLELILGLTPRPNERSYNSMLY